MDPISTLMLILLFNWGRGDDQVAVRENNTTSGCKSPEVGDNIELMTSSKFYPINFNITMRCINSTLIGERNITCQNSGKWSASKAYCKETHCSEEPDIPINGFISLYIDNKKNFSVDVKYACYNEYNLIGNNTRHCLPNGSYSGTLPRCLKICPPPHVPTNGSVHIDCSVPNCTAIYMCNNGHQITGDQMNKCSEDGSWNHDVLPQCKKIYCTSPPKVENTETNVNISQELFEYGSKVVYSCASNFTLFGNITLRCGMNGNWQGSIPHCVVTAQLPVTTGSITSHEQTTFSTTDATDSFHCPKPESLVHGRFHVHGQITLLYTCNPGYTLIGIHERTCFENKTWSNKAPTCVAEKLADTWKHVFLEYREWEGIYVYWEQPVHFKLWVLENRHPGQDHIEVLLDDSTAKLYVKVSYASGALRFEMIRLFTQSQRFKPGHDWAFKGYLRKYNHHWQINSNTFFSDPGFVKLTMSPKKVYEPPPPIPELTEPEVNIVAMTLGITIAMISIIIAATVAAFFVKRRTLKATGHRSVTSFENPVYDYQNSLKDQEQYQEPTEC